MCFFMLKTSSPHPGMLHGTSFLLPCCRLAGAGSGLEDQNTIVLTPLSGSSSGTGDLDLFCERFPPWAGRLEDSFISPLGLRKGHEDLSCLFPCCLSLMQEWSGGNFSCPADRSFLFCTLMP